MSYLKHRFLKLVVDHTHVAGSYLERFPIFVDVKNPGLKSVQNGGQVHHVNALYFVAADETVLHHEMTFYDPESGSLKVWVQLPCLSQETDTVFFLCLREMEKAANHSVWEDHLLVVHERVQDDVRDTFVRAPISAQALTVESWMYCPEVAPETFQVLVAAWSLREQMDAFESYDAGMTDGLDTKGFFGAVCDGRYVYFAPQRNDSGIQHGQVLRFDSQGQFDDPASWTAYDAGNTSGLNTKGYYGAVHAGDYVYFIPRTDGQSHHSRILRYDTRTDFCNSESWQAYDIGHVVSYQSAAYDGRYLYLTPGYEHDGSESGRAVRYDTRGDFTDPNNYVTYDASHTDGLETKNYDGACFDGRYVYYAPLNNRGMALRCDTKMDFDAPESWQAVDVSNCGLHTCVGVVFDGRYIYYVPYAHSMAVRYDTKKDFRDPTSWQAYDAGNTSGFYTKGYDGACFDGRFVYYIPFYEGDEPASGFHCRMLRYDTLQNFDDSSAWDAVDGRALTTPPNPGGFNGGAFDGRYIYGAPWREDPGPDDKRPYTPHGKVLRYDTARDDASFNLKFVECGHNGGLGASLPGVTFTLSTFEGSRSVRANYAIEAGWHHVAGVYDGERILLYVDGKVAGETTASGRVMLQTPLGIGCLPEGGAMFRGQILQTRISRVARSQGWIETTARNLVEPDTFVRVE